ncbi:hypothetical protein AB0G54_23610 [Streptomyces yokosukanensis]|uniref:hypothetical protein n=1 Tax=Streptomyces yokosukanensis TaxID=67386 RepID=UPI0008300C93|nr:hypothetical protein [Streptomyces yokosukanensis]
MSGLETVMQNSWLPERPQWAPVATAWLPERPQWAPAGSAWLPERPQWAPQDMPAEADYYQLVPLA